MSISSDITRIQGAKDDIISAINAKGGSATGKKIHQLASEISGLNIGGSGGGIDTSDATAYASDLRSGMTAYARGSKITGTIANYAGSTSVSPSTSAQTLSTNGKFMTGNITVAAMPAYSGSYSVTPSTSAQTLYTQNKYLTQNITVAAASGGSSQAFQMNSGSVSMSGSTCSLNVGFVPRVVGLVITRSNTTKKFVVVYNAASGVVWQSNDSGGYHTHTTASVSGTTVTFNFKLNNGGAMTVSGSTPWVAAGYSA